MVEYITVKLDSSILLAVIESLWKNSRGIKLTNMYIYSFERFHEFIIGHVCG